MWNSGDVHPFTGGPTTLRIQDTHHVNKDSIPITVFLSFMEVIQMLVAETNKYYN
jgi:hypothetical protein